MPLFSLVRNIITVLVVVIFVATIHTPAPLKFVLRRTFYTPDYECLPADSRSRVEQHAMYTLYSETHHRHRSVIVVIVGGAFVFNNRRTHYGLTNELWSRMRERHDIMLVAYPVRFSSTLRDAMLSLNETLVRARDDYSERHLMAVSAGALLAGTFARKELEANYARLIDVPRIGLRFESFVGVCGVYSTSFELPLVDAAFKLYVLRGTPNGARYTCQGLNLPTLLVATRDDFLYAQSERFARTVEDCETLFFDASQLPHSFVQMIHLRESQLAIDRICAFVDRAATAAAVAVAV